MTALAWVALGIALGVAASGLRRRRPDSAAAPAEGLDSDEPLEAGGLWATSAPPHLFSLIAQALREPVRILRHSGSEPEALAKLDHLVWQVRMLASRPRAMRAVPTSPLSLLQEAAEEVPLLRDGVVGASWSILNREPAHVDPERLRAAFRELLSCGAEIAGGSGRMGIKILRGGDPGFPVQIEIEIGRRGTEIDPLVLLVTRHIVESEGGRLELDGNVTRIRLRHSAPEPLASVA